MNANARLEKVFVNALGITANDSRIDLEGLEYRGIGEWDSVGHMMLVSELEAEFDVMFETDEVIGMSSFQKAREFLIGHGVDFGA